MITKLYIRAEQALIDFKKDQRGVTAIEYAIIAAAISAALITAFSGDAGIAKAITTKFTAIKTAISG